MFAFDNFMLKTMLKKYREVYTENLSNFKPSAVDPIHKLKLIETITALYFKFDMALVTREVQKSYV